MPREALKTVHEEEVLSQTTAAKRNRVKRTVQKEDRLVDLRQQDSPCFRDAYPVTRGHDWQPKLIKSQLQTKVSNNGDCRRWLQGDRKFQ